MTEHPLELLREQPRLAEPAAFTFDFDLRRAEHGEEVRLASGATLEAIAGDDTGGTFFLCGGGGVLYASSDGQAGLLGDSVTEALEVIVGLPGWQDYVHLAPEDGEERLLAEIAEVEDAIRASYGPDLDAQRAELRAGLGLPERSPVELIARLHGALLRTEPDHLLLTAEELLAYRLLDERLRTPLRDVVLAAGLPLPEGPPGADGSGQDPADEPKPTSDERESTSHESELTWVRLARDQGLTEHARVALIRMLDDTGPDAKRLSVLSDELALLGDFAQAARARREVVSLQDTAWDRAREGRTLAMLERSAGDLAAAWRTLRQIRHVLGIDKPAPEPTGQWEQLGIPLAVEPPEKDPMAWQWHRRGLGRMITEEHLRLVLAAVEAGDPDFAREVMAHGARLLKLIGKFRKEMGTLPQDAKWAVARLKG
ncbi:hypothetical protein FCH28_00440 [Streptomyces piniterrae]|uniref:Uncharacterized protein n=1 Tax=Streptomyces piniterrae TaxID=2571125 RepID=A0A4U0NVT4_9ACTN|nr:hypothetical protein [Streptomyces piniterrae]TJZ58690.1 hypothetical protein FCH28_00440 [Streptomyces piniterrae]